MTDTYEAKRKLSGLLRRAREGEEISTAQAGVPLARLVPIEAATGGSRLGLDARAFLIPARFDEPFLDDY